MCISLYKKFRITSLLLATILFTSFNASAGQKLNSVIAIVNDEVITASELNSQYKMFLSRVDNRDELPPREILEKQLLNKIILDKIQLQLAKRQNVIVSSKEINDTILRITQQEKITLQELKDNLQKAGINYQNFRENIKEQLIISELQNREIGLDTTVSESEIESFISSPAGQDLTGTEYRFGHILLAFPEDNSSSATNKTAARAKAIVAKLKKGADFGKIAITKSDGANALEGGDLGWRTIGQIPTLFVQGVSNLKVGEIMGPIKSPSGYHIVKLKQKRVGTEDLHQEIHARQVLIIPNQKLSDKAAKEKLVKLRNKIINGANFNKIAQEHSEELSTNYKGGDLGWLVKDKVLPDFYQVITKLKINDISQPFKTKMGWHLVQVLGKRSNNTSLLASRNRARAILHTRKFNERLELWLKRLRSNARIKDYFSYNS